MLHDFDDGVLHEALGLVEHHGLRGRDAIHAATALRNDFTEIVTFDTGVDHCPRPHAPRPGVRLLNKC